MLNTLELKEKLQELINIDKNNEKALVVLRCFDKEGNPQDIPIYDAHRLYVPREKKDVYTLEPFIRNEYQIDITEKEGN